MIEDGAVVLVGDPGPRPVHLLFSEPTRPFGGDPTLDFLVKARGQWASVETLVRTWDGDGIDTFLSTPAEDFETTTVHTAGEEMRNLAAEIHTFLTSTVE